MIVRLYSRLTLSGMQCARTILSSVACPARILLFQHYLTNAMILGRKLLENKMCVLIILTCRSCNDQCHHIHTLTMVSPTNFDTILLVFDTLLLRYLPPCFSLQTQQQSMQPHHRINHIDYNWINQLSNTTIWWLDICCLLHRYQLHVSALMAIFRLID